MLMNSPKYCLNHEIIYLYTCESTHNDLQHPMKHLWVVAKNVKLDHQSSFITALILSDKYLDN